MSWPSVHAVSRPASVQHPTRRQFTRLAALSSLLAAPILPGCCGKGRGQDSAPWVAAAEASPAKKVGVFDAAGCQSIRGWAWDPRRPDDPVKVDIYDGNQLLMTLIADQHRTDLLDLGFGNGNHAFEMAPLAKLSDGNTHAIHAKFSATKYELNNSPKSFVCYEEDSDETPSAPGTSKAEDRPAP